MEVDEPDACWILCCSCGLRIEPNAANRCLGCIRKEVDITEGMAKQITLQSCRSCERYLNGSTGNGAGTWVNAAVESRELLALCLKKCKIQGRSGEAARLVDAGFLWTEPHSRRLKVKVTLQKEVYPGMVLQQAYAVEVVLANQQCPDCEKVMAKNTWKAVVQLRQKVGHKRTFLFLEQLILKHHAHRECSNIKGQPDGLDFYFQQRNHAHTFCEFVASVMPVRVKHSEQLISLDTHSGSSSFKFTFSVEMVPLCKDDLVVLSEPIRKQLGGVSPACLVAKVAHAIYLLDPRALSIVEVPGDQFWRTPLPATGTLADLTSFLVLDVEQTRRSGKYVLADITIARPNDMGNPFVVRSHLGGLLKPGDTALGYDLAQRNFGGPFDDFMAMHGDAIESVILVKKHYERRTRRWHLKHLDKANEDEEMMVEEVAPSMSKRKQKVKKSNVQQHDDHDEKDVEAFLQQLEQDADMRQHVNLYKSKIDYSLIAPSSEDEIDIAELLDDLALD